MPSMILFEIVIIGSSKGRILLLLLKPIHDNSVPIVEGCNVKLDLLKAIFQRVDFLVENLIWLVIIFTQSRCLNHPT